MRSPLRWLIFLTLIVGLAWYVITPRRTYDRFLTALLIGSEAELAATVDFPTLRDNLKDDLRPILQEAAGTLGESAGGFLLDRAVNSVLTPSGLSQLVTGFGTRRRRPDQAQDVAEGTVTSYHYRSPSRVEIRIRSAADPERAAGILTFSRSFFTWRLTRISSDRLTSRPT